MSKERAQRRAAREREAALRAEQRAREAERRDRRAARRDTLLGWLPERRRTPGALAARRRREVTITICVLIALNVLVWVVRPDWQARLGALLVSILVAPVLHVLFVRR